MFLDTGDGVVIRGNFGPWYSPQSKQLHLNREEAKDLLTMVLETYRELHGQTLSEVFLHYRSRINEEEYRGFASAVPQGVKLVAIQIRVDGDFKLFREGRYPIPPTRNTPKTQQRNSPPLDTWLQTQTQNIRWSRDT